MADRRLEFHEILVGIIGSRNVYFQPPEKRQMEYPCIVYELSGIKTFHANNRMYTGKRRYSVTLISADPDSEILEKLIALPLCEFNRHFTTENLNHDAFSVYF